MKAGFGSQLPACSFMMARSPRHRPHRLPHGSSLALFGLLRPFPGPERQYRLEAGLARAGAEGRTTTSSSSAAAGTASRPPTTSPRNTASPTSPCSRRAGIGSGNIGRNTTIIRSNYLLPGNIPFYEWSLKLWEGLEQDLNYNAMVSQRGVLNLCPFRRAARRRSRAAATPCGMHGVDAELLDARGRAQARARFSISTMRAFRSMAASCSRAAAPCATTRSPGAMRARADARGVDIIQNCEVTGIRVENGRVVGVETDARLHRRKKIGLAAAGHSSRGRRHGGAAPADREPCPAGLRVRGRRSRSSTRVVTFGAGHFYISQSDKGGLVFGGDIDGYNSYAQRGNLPMVEDVMEDGGRHDSRRSGALRVLRQLGRR